MKKWPAVRAIRDSFGLTDGEALVVEVSGLRGLSRSVRLTAGLAVWVEFIIELSVRAAPADRNGPPLDNVIGPTIELPRSGDKGANPRDKLIEIGRVRVASVPLCLVANWEKMVGKPSGSTAEVVKVFRYQDVFATEVSRNIARPVNTCPLNRRATGKIVNAITKALLERSTLNIWNAVRPAGTGVNVVVPQRHNFLDTHRIHQAPAQVSAWRVL